ncbi:MAG: hypothetical protein U0235_10275 [Polyangiaceae bacterium]
MVFRRAALTADMNRNPEAIAHDGDRAEAEAMQRDPLVVRWFSMRYLLAQKRVMDRAAENAAVLSAPLLLVQGMRRAGRSAWERRAARRIAVGIDKQRCIAPAAGHGASAVEGARGDRRLAHAPRGRMGTPRVRLSRSFGRCVDRKLDGGLRPLTSVHHRRRQLRRFEIPVSDRWWDDSPYVARYVRWAKSWGRSERGPRLRNEEGRSRVSRAHRG